MEYGPELPPDADEEPDALPRNLAHSLVGHDGAVLAVRFNSQGTYCLSCGKDRSIRLWNPERGIHIKTYEGHGYEVRDVSVALDNSKFCSGGGDRQIFLWDVASGKTIRRFKGHEKTINTVVYGADDQIIVSGSYDTFVHIWDCRSRNYNAIQTLGRFKDSVTSAWITSQEIFVGSVDGTLKRFDIRMGQVCSDDFHEPITSIAVSGDSQCVLAACMCSKMVLTDKSSGLVLATYKGHRHESYKIECGFVAADAFVVGGSEDGCIFYWDLVNATVVNKFKAHKDTVCSLAIHPEAQMLLTTSTDGVVQVWAPG